MHPHPSLRLAFAATAALCAVLTTRAADVTPALPNIPERTFAITDFGAKPDDAADATAAFTKAIAAVHAAGGGHLVVPAGIYHVGALELCGKLDLRLEKGARLLFSQNPDVYRVGATGRKFRPLVHAANVEDLAITGEGALDGQGAPWWVEERKFKDAARARGDANEEIGRPRLLVIEKSKRVLLDGITLANSPQFHCAPTRCEDFTARNVTVRAPADAPNTDGIDPSASRRVLITGCTFDTGDDCIAIKSGDADFPSADILVENCVFKRGHGMSVGSETNGGLKNLTVRDCTFDGTDAGVRLKSARGKGGLVENCTYENLTMRGVAVAIYITSYYPEKLIPKPGATVSTPETRYPKTPAWRNIVIRNVTATGCVKSAGIIVGLPDEPVDGLLLDNDTIDAPVGIRFAWAKNVVLKNATVHVTKAGGQPFLVEPSAQVARAK